jgi:hypothetical protein
MKPDSLEYKIIDECKCGFEELFNLIGFVDFSETTEIDRLVKTLVNLNQGGYLNCKFGKENKKNLTELKIREHIQKRIKYGEDLESYPKSGEEYSFFATDKAINILREEDKPIKQP